MALSNKIDLENARPKLERWLSSRLHDGWPARITSMSVPQSSGMSALTVVFETEVEDDQKAVRGHRKFVARAVPREGGVFGHCDLAREFELLSRLHDQTAVPVPRPFGLENDDESILGNPFMIMEAVEGRVAADDPPYTQQGWVMDLTAQQRARLSDNALRAFANIHDVDLQRLGLEWLGDNPMGSPAIADKLEGQRQYYAWACRGRPHPVVKAGFDWLASNMPAETSGPVISWGDARLGNMIIADDLDVSAVIDWEMAGLGAREIDLGWWIYTRRFHTVGIGVELPSGFPGEDQILARYETLTGYTPRHLDYYITFAALRMCTSFARLAHMMIDAGLVSADTPMLTNSPALELLADYVGAQRPAGKAEYFAGNR